MRLSEQRSSMLHGVLLITLFACAAFYIGDMNWVKALSFSPMVVGIIIGMLYANSLRNNLPDTWVPGIQGGRIKMRSPPKVLTGNFRPSQLSFFLS